MNNGYATLVANQFFADESRKNMVFTEKRVMRNFAFENNNYAIFGNLLYFCVSLRTSS